MSPKFLKISAVILILISLFSIFYIWQFQRNRGLDLTVEILEEVWAGVPFAIKVNFSNSSGAVLNDARLTLALPEGAAFWGSPAEKNIENKNIGNVGSGGLVQEQFSVVVFPLPDGEETGSRDFKASVSYAPASLGARFEKSRQVSALVKSSGLAAEITAPEKIASGEEFEMTVAYKNVSDSDFSGLELKMEYPPGFSFVSSSLKPDSDNNVWQLGDLRKNSDGKFTVRGNVIGGAGDPLEFKSGIFTKAGSQSYLVARGLLKSEIAASPLSLAILVNNDKDYVAKAGDDLNYILSYVNSADEVLRDVSISIQLAGELFDFSTVQGRAFFRPSDNTLIFNSANTPEFLLVPAGSAGAVNFSIKTKKDYPIRRFSDKNFVLSAYGNIESSGKNLSSRTKLETRVSGAIMADALGYFRDAESGFLNQGPFPPKAGEKTNFTIHWRVKALAADVSKVEVRGTLGNNVKMIGEAKSNSGSLPVYDASSNEVVWQIDKIQANQGAVSDPIEAVFQVEAAPSKEQVGNYLPLIGPTFARAIDDWSGKELLNNDVGITTALPDDATVGSQGGIVQP